MYKNKTRHRSKRYSKKKRNRKTKRYNRKMKGGTIPVELVPGKFYRLANINNVDPNSVYEFIKIAEKTDWENREYYPTLPNSALRWQEYLNGGYPQLEFVFRKWVGAKRADELTLFLFPTQDINASVFNIKRTLF